MNRKSVIAVFASFFSLLLLFGCEKNSEDENAQTETMIGYITNIDVDKKTLIFDPIEWITKDNSKRIKELNIDEGDFPNGFYRYNPIVDSMEYRVGDDATFEFLNYEENFLPTSATFEEFANQHNEFFSKFYEPMEESFSNFTPYWIEIKDGTVIDVQQQYIP